jgi:hypothetical protein
VVLLDLVILGHHHQQLDRHIRWEERERGRAWERVLKGVAAPLPLVSGDSVAAYRAEHLRLHEWRRTLRWAIAGLLAAGVVGTIWLVRKTAPEDRGLSREGEIR